MTCHGVDDPDINEVLKIRSDGRLARDQGNPVSSCPYPEGTQANYQWVSGWTQPQATAPEDES